MSKMGSKLELHVAPFLCKSNELVVVVSCLVCIPIYCHAAILHICLSVYFNSINPLFQIAREYNLLILEDDAYYFLAEVRHTSTIAYARYAIATFITKHIIQYVNKGLGSVVVFLG